MLGRRRLVDTATADWVLDRTGWLISALGPDNFFARTSLVLPTRTFFPDLPRDRAEAAQTLFDTVKGHMGITHWPARLVPRAIIGQHDTAPFAPNSVAGTFYHSGEDAVITYDPRLMGHRNAFVGTMAHELAHYLLLPHAATAPGGDAEHEMLTDLTVILAGFGVIDLIGARQVGWQGYLGLDARTFALALFLDLKGMDPAAAHHHLSPKRARKFV